MINKIAVAGQNSLALKSGEMWNKIDKLFQQSSVKEPSLSDNMQIIENKGLSVREMLNYQVQAYSYHLRVEIVSKVASAASGTLQKLQS